MQGFKHPVVSLTWLTDEPVWNEQWPLPTEKLLALRSLVKEQLLAGHIENSFSPWNRPMFVIKKKSGKWRLVHYLRWINAVMAAMGALQSGLPTPTMIPQGWEIIIIYLKGCFFTIPLADQGKEKFAFTVPSFNHEEPDQRYQWTVLPQGMRNSPSSCQWHKLYLRSESNLATGIAIIIWMISCWLLKVNNNCWLLKNVL